jgi:hypothetical protein
MLWDLILYIQAGGLQRHKYTLQLGVNVTLIPPGWTTDFSFKQVKVVTSFRLNNLNP